MFHRAVDSRKSPHQIAVGACLTRCPTRCGRAAMSGSEHNLQLSYWRTIIVKCSVFKHFLIERGLSQYISNYNLILRCLPCVLSDETYSPHHTPSATDRSAPACLRACMCFKSHPRPVISVRLPPVPTLEEAQRNYTAATSPQAYASALDQPAPSLCVRIH